MWNDSAALQFAGAHSRPTKCGRFFTALQDARDSYLSYKIWETFDSIEKYKNLIYIWTNLKIPKNQRYSEEKHVAE